MEEKLYHYSQSLEAVKRVISFYESFESTLAGKSSRKSRYIRIITDEYLSVKSEQRILLYKGIIISIYGAWESFVRGVVVQYATSRFLRKQNYPDYPKEFKVSYVNKYMEHLSRQSGEWKSSEKCQELIGEIYNGISGQGCFINEDVFFKNYANYRISIINDLSTIVGIGNVSSRIMSLDKFKNYMSNEDDSYGSIKNQELRHRLAYKNLEDLVEERNTVAHGKGTLTLMSSELLLKKVEYFMLLGECLVNVFQDELVLNGECCQEDLTYIEKISGNMAMFKINSIVKKGDKLTVIKGDGKCCEREILCMLDASESEIEQALSSMIISIKFESKVKQDWKFYKKIQPSAQ
ncbi:MAG TPA: HEPN domain-containing protein [Solidesulfovibrio magneticus]|nr:HEPN domain-containing protein [Solidesulfovibrio magneticus]